jgi:HSP20 family molecular chaperone IbpA
MTATAPPTSVIDRTLDRTFDQLISSLFTPVRRGPEVLASRDGDTLVLTVDLSGVAAEPVGVDTAGHTLTLLPHRCSGLSRYPSSSGDDHCG